MFNKREDFFLNNSSSSIGINLTQVKTLMEKLMMLGLKKWKKTRHHRSNHSRSRGETRNSNNKRNKSKSTERIVLSPRNN